MKKVVSTLRKNEDEARKSVLRLEMDYELTTLHDAMVANDLIEQEECKDRLEKLRQEWMQLD